MDRKKQMDKKWTIGWIYKMDGWMHEQKKQMVRRKYNKYEHKIDGWQDGWIQIDGWLDGQKQKAYEQIDGQKNISKIDGWLNG